MINERRGEVAINLAGKIYVMRPTFEVLSRIEACSGKGIIALAKHLTQGTLGLEDLSSVVMAAVGSDWVESEQQAVALVKNAIVSQGINNAVEAVAQFLTVALDGVDSVCEED